MTLEALMADVARKRLEDVGSKGDVDVADKAALTYCLNGLNERMRTMLVRRHVEDSTQEAGATI